MRLFLPPLEIGEEDGFTTGNDLFGKKPVADGLTNLVTSVDQPLVVALDAQWGSGKSTFLKMWAGELRKLGIGVVFFDAFENDYTDDAFSTIAGQIVSLARDKSKESEGRVKRFAEKALETSKIIARSAIKVGVKVGTAGALKAEDLEAAGKDIAAELSGLTDKYLGELITRQKEQKEAIEEFRSSLAELPALLSNSNGAANNGARRPLVIIIDELDRCRPSFALEVLERIKHFFSVSDVHFVLGVHLGQLENSVKAAYGSEIDAHVYLQKFITLPVHLSDSARSDTSSPEKFTRYAVEKLALPSDNAKTFADIVIRVAELNNLSLRTIEKILTNIAMTLAFSDERTMRPVILVAGLCILRVTHPALFIKAKLGALEYSDIEYIFGFNRPVGQNPFASEYARYLWMYATGVEINEDNRARVERTLSKYHYTDRSFIIPHVAASVMDRFLPPSKA